MQPTAPSKDSNVTFWHRRTSSDSNQSSTRPLCPAPTLTTVFFTTLHSNGCHKAVVAAKKVIVACLKARRKLLSVSAGISQERIQRREHLVLAGL